MNEHEKLKKICDEIGYEKDFFLYLWDGEYFKYIGCANLSIRDIIFSKEFMDKFVKYYDNKTLLGPKRIYEQLGLTLLENNLDNPLDYLYNLIK